MLAPIDKLKSGVNDIIQIVVTTACTLNCSNCTQLLPFRKDYLHMGLECFREAVESVREWPGVVALFGGNPCSHPQFPALCQILKEVIPETRRRGLWSNDLLRHGQVAYDTFWPDGRFNLNAHGVPSAAMRIKGSLMGKLIMDSDVNQSQHAPILIDYRDLGMPREAWEEKRESCDINQKWSGAIVERAGRPYAYFCEVAASLDGIKGQNHGVLATPGWWVRGMNNGGFADGSREFLHQVRQCCDKGCGVPLRLKSRLDKDEIYDVSESWLLSGQVLSPRPTSLSVVANDSVKFTHEVTDYMGRRGSK